MVNFASSVAVYDTNDVVTTMPLRDPDELLNFFGTTADGESDLYGSDGSMSLSLDESEVDEEIFMDTFEEIQPAGYFTSQMEMSFNKSMALRADDVPFDLDDNFTDLKDVSMGFDKSVPDGVPSETSSQSEPDKEQPEEPTDGKLMKDMAKSAAWSLAIPFFLGLFRRFFEKKDDDVDVPVTNMADQAGSQQSVDPSSMTQSRSELMSSAAQSSSRNAGAMYLDAQ
jgi:hypothetical protein